jgi:lycopene beta-cyclase
MDADVLIAGAGCAGLSLAVHLRRDSLGELRTVLVEPRALYERDRTWCFWSLRDHPFEKAVSHSWNRWRVDWTGGEAVRSSSAIAYRHLPADAFYRMALGRLENEGNIEVLRGVRVDALEEDGGSVVARTTEGEIRTRLAFDSRRPPSLVPGRHGRHITLLQHFLGLVVQTEAPVFDPTTATVMDFRVDQSNGIHFIYVLPYDERTALVEDTYFSETPREERHYLAALETYLSERVGVSGWQELHRETGVIPMTTALAATEDSRGSRIVPIGVRAGLARPSTGYAFMAIQRDSVRLAELLARQGVEEPVKRPKAYSRATRFLDRVFLSYIHRHPERAPELFGTMFGAVAPESLARFLFDGGGAADRLRVMAALPGLPLTAEAVRGLPRPW